MKRLIPILLIISAALLAGCTLPGIGAPAPTYTPYPTYTPFPTATETQTPTATFLPSATTLPTSTATPEGGTPTVAATSTPAGISTGVLLYGANLREGPGTDYRALALMNAGDTLTIRGRDFDGRWLCVTTAGGTDGWIAVQQFQGPLDVARIPVCSLIPTPNATQQARGTNTPRPGTTPTAGGTPGTPVATTNPSAGNYFELLAGGPEVCNTVTIVMNGQFHVDSKTADILPFDTVTPHDEVRRSAYKHEKHGFPLYLDIYPQGNAKPGQCETNDNVCEALTVRLCARATADAPTGGWEYRDFAVVLVIGTQSYDVFYEEARGTFGLVFKIPEKR